MKKLSIVALLFMSAITIVPTGTYAQGPIDPLAQASFIPLEAFYWTGADRSKVLTLNQPRTGEFNVTFQYTSGAAALEIRKVEVFDSNDQSIAVDIHDGWAGTEHTNNVYTFNTGDQVATKIICQLEPRGTDSNGTIIISDYPIATYGSIFSPTWEGSKAVTTDADWNNGQNWIALPSGTRPGGYGNNFAIDGRVIGDKIPIINGYKTVNAKHNLDQYNGRVGVYHGAHLYVNELYRIQNGDTNGGRWDIDESSRITINRIGGSRKIQGKTDLHIHSLDGIIFPSNLSGVWSIRGIFNLYLYEKGSFKYPGSIKAQVPHHIKALTLHVGAGDIKRIVSRRLISFTSSTNITYHAQDAVITLMPEGSPAATQKDSMVDPLVDAIGTCYFSQKADGYYVDYIVAVASTEAYTTTLDAPTPTWGTIQWQNGGLPVTTPVSFAYTTLNFTVPTSTSLEIGAIPSTHQADLTFTGAGNLIFTNPTIPASYNFADMIGQVTLNSETGSATIIAGTDTILTQRGEGGTLTVGEGKKVTLPKAYRGTLTGNLGSIVSQGALLIPTSTSTFTTGTLELIENTNTTIDGSQIATAITLPITGAGNLIFKTRGGTNDDGGGGSSFGSITNAANCTGSLTIATGLLDISSTEKRDNLPKGNIILAGGGLCIQRSTLTLTKNIEVRDGQSYIRAYGSNTYSLTLTGSITGSSKAIIRHVDGGYLRFEGDLSQYYGKIDVRRGAGPAITTTADTIYDTFPGSIATTHGDIRLNIGRDLTVSGIISGSRQLTKNHAAKLTLTGANTLTGPIQVNGGTLQSSSLSLGAAPVSLATAATALKIDLTEEQYTALTTQTSPMVQLCSVTGDIDTFENKTFLYYNDGTANILVNDEANVHEITFVILDQKLYAIKNRINAQLTSTTENVNWTTAPWLDDSNSAISDWTQHFGFLTITIPAIGEASLTLDQNVTADFLHLLPSGNGTGTLAIRQDANNAYTLTTPSIDASATTHAVTLDFHTGATNVKVGADTIFTQAGTGTITVGPNKKATLGTEGWTGDISLAGTPNSTNLATLNAATDINVPPFTLSGPFALAANSGKTLTIADAASTSAGNSAYYMYITGEGTVKLSTKLERMNSVIVNKGATFDISHAKAALFKNPNAANLFTIRGSVLSRDWNWDANKALGLLSLRNQAAVTLDGGAITFTESFESGRPFTVTASGATLSVNEGKRYVKTLGDKSVPIPDMKITNNASLILTGAGEGVIQDPITGTNVSVTKRGTGIWMLEGINNYTGATNIEAGTLKIPLAQVAPTTVKTGATLAFLTGGTSGKAQMVTVENNVTIDLSALGDEDTILGGFQLSEGVISANVNINVTGRTLVEGQTLLTWDAANVIPAGLTAILTGASDPTFFIKKVNNSLLVSKVDIAITGGDISQNVMDYLARNLTESITLTQAQANMLYLFKLPITKEALTFKVNDIQVVKGEGEAYSVIVTATLNGITLTETHNVNGSFQLLAGTSPNVVTPVPNLATKTALTNGTVSFEVPLGEDRYFKIRITDIQ